MASSDARPVPRKNVAYRATFPIFDADGDLVTGATGLDSEVSKDGGTFADCTNEATEIATSSGMYYLDLTSTEMNADTVAIIVKTSSSGAKTTALVLYPEELGDFRVDPQTIWDALTAALSTANSIGKLLVDNINATIGSRLASAGYTAPDNSGIGVAAAAAVSAAADAATAAAASANLDVAVSSRLADDDYTAPPSASAIATEVWAAVLDGTRSAAQLMRGFAAVLLGKSSGLDSGAPKYRNIDDDKDVVDGVSDEHGNRSAVTLDLT